MELTDSYKRQLLQDLPQEFVGIQVDDVVDFKTEDDGTETGIIISGDKRYRYRIDDNQKILEEINEG
ncbi:hypothetical protein D0962_23365 [Leptolyngbyaceae cyanobacterium CCMR0082]|uniref:Uncharacterized protein n=2 Tax=Adonisia TaxID=2950183 RepID=A0A6M0SAY3_9CYAN|nr:hypothetical protein [Adonisia turfae CCMR0082]